MTIKYFLDKPSKDGIDLRLQRRTPGASGYDLMANLGCERDLPAGQRWVVPTGLYLEMPLGVEAQVRTRGGLARDHGVAVLNAPGTVDSDDRGEIQVVLVNLGHAPYRIVPGGRVAQLVFCPVFADMPHWPKPASEHGTGPEHRGGHLVLRRVWDLRELRDTVLETFGFGSTGRG